MRAIPVEAILLRRKDVRAEVEVLVVVINKFEGENHCVSVL